MDFKRIARIFILAFGLLNIYLMMGVIERQDIQNISTQPTSDILTNITDSDILLPENLSATDVEDVDIYSLQVDTNTLLAKELSASKTLTGAVDGEGVYYRSFPSNALVLDGNASEGYSNDDLDKIKNFVYSEEVVLGEEYQFNRFDREGSRFVFYQEINGIPIMDGTSEISLFVNDQGNVISYEQTYAGPGTPQGNALQLISGTRAIEILFLNNEIRQGSTVELPILTYRRALHLEDLSMYSPAWVINVEYSSERNTFRVDAVNGTIIRQSTPAPVDNSNNSAEEETDSEESSNF